MLVTRAAHQAEDLVAALRERGLDAAQVPAIAIEPMAEDALDEAIGQLASYAWTVVTSANGARAAIEAIARNGAPIAATRWAVVGAGTGAVFEAAGGRVDFTPTRPSGAHLAAELPVAPGSRILVLRADLADGSVADALLARGAMVHDVVAYRTLEAPASSSDALRDAFAAGPVDLVVFTSASTVRGLVALADAEAVDVTTMGAVCIGASTARAAREAGFRVLATPEMPTDAALADAVARVVRPEASIAR